MTWLQLAGPSGHETWQLRSASPAKLMASMGAGAVTDSPMLGSTVPMPSILGFGSQQPTTAASVPVAQTLVRYCCCSSVARVQGFRCHCRRLLSSLIGSSVPPCFVLSEQRDAMLCLKLRQLCCMHQHRRSRTQT